MLPQYHYQNEKLFQSPQTKSKITVYSKIILHHRNFYKTVHNND